ncbi:MULTISPECIES: hypothetical protein [Shewanella]|uniref:Uncharacterized protein n=1 Tax=Shewanella electrodiphila TaxID=934143 RepID=A0ABT0KQV2_9GAMM|nr:hypothetical protein [Shewanella electrodiphila]MCL1046044.1 hypothetical protein [Shewanella electrodiphila]
MKSRVILFGMLLISFHSFGAESLSCNIGPIHTEIATANWQVTSCSDGKSLVFATMKDNPAMPFMFFINRAGEKKKISGEGNGAKEYTSKAFKELKLMSEIQLNELVQATQEIGKSN